MKWIAWLVGTACIGACVPATRGPHVREQPLPARYESVASGQNVASLDWRAFFADDSLNALIGEALSGSFDLQIALQRVELARASVRGARGARLPQLSAVAGAAVRKYGLYTMDGAGNAATEITNGQRVPEHLPDFLFGLQASWEPDLWGRLRSLEGAARTQYLASIEGAKLVVTSLVADIATSYFALVALDRVQEILTQTMARQSQALQIMRLEKQAGRTTELAIQQFEAQLAGTRALSAETDQRTRELENRINLLVGRMPQQVSRTRGVLDRAVAPTIAAGVPSELLRNRPDIRQAELHVEATRFDLAAARAAFYPRLTISANAGYQAFDPRFLVRTPESIAYGLVGGLVAPLVNRRGIEAAFAAAQATQLEAMFNYQRAVVTSFTEVSTGLYTLARAADIVEQHKQKRDAAAGTVDTADLLFRAGKATYLDILLAQQATLDAELELVGAQRDQHIASIRLYRALGGGWRGTLRVE